MMRIFICSFVRIGLAKKTLWITFFGPQGCHCWCRFYEYSKQIFVSLSQKCIASGGDYVKNNLLYAFINPSAMEGCLTKLIFKWSKAGLNSEISFSSTSYLTKTKEPNLPYYLPIYVRITYGFMPLSRKLARGKTQTTSSRILSRVTDSFFTMITVKLIAPLVPTRLVKIKASLIINVGLKHPNYN